MKTLKWKYVLMASLLSCGLRQAAAQAVAVTLRLDTNTISVGSTTHLHVAAQVLPAFRAGSDRIFSWYVDVINTNGTAASANYALMQKTASDNDASFSSTGTTVAANRRGIYDTFLGLAGAGVNAPVELMDIPITGAAAGRTRFLIQAGSGVPQMSADFLVAPSGGGDALVGGDYSAAFVDLLVVGPANLVRPALTISVVPLTGGTNQATLHWSLIAGQNYFLQYQDQLSPVSPWQTFAGGPHNSGNYIDTTKSSTRSYRLLTVQGP
jgi:hypothetical protein